MNTKKLETGAFVFPLLLLLITICGVRATTFYVDLNSPNPTPPYTTWGTAATNIQDAINAAAAGDVVLVTNGNTFALQGGGFPSNNIGVYMFGGQSIYGYSNRVAITKPITVQSVNGPQYTWIMGAGYYANVRCVYMTNGATLVGFTVTNGTAILGSQIQGQCGGGIWSESTNDLITNCVITGCSGGPAGGGVLSGTFNNCLLTNNPGPLGDALYGGAAASNVMFNCVLINNHANNGGGAAYSTLYNCTLEGNTAQGAAGALGGGALLCTLYSCLLTNNSCPLLYGYPPPGSPQMGCGGAVCGGALTNCTIVNNSAYAGGGAFGNQQFPLTMSGCLVISNFAYHLGGGVSAGNEVNSFIPSNCVLNNCTIISNCVDDYGGGAYGATLNNCFLMQNIAARGGGSEGGILNQCFISGNEALNYQGGGIDGSEVVGFCIANNCILSNNVAGQGGGALFATLNNCLLIANTAGTGGGGYQSTFNNCTIVSNSAPVGEGGGVCNSLAENTIIYDNNGGNYYSTYAGNPFWLYYCCTTPAITGPGNITNDPAFVNPAAGDFHLQPNSPCINSGDNFYVTNFTDLDGNPRIVGGTVDIGA
jgi:hypothetical protein